MTWTKLDDSFWCHPKVDAVGNEAAGAFCRMLSYCGQHNSDGVVPNSIARYITRPAALSRLAGKGLVEPKGDDWFIPDYLDFNPSKAEVEERRQANAARVRKHRSKKDKAA